MLQRFLLILIVAYVTPSPSHRLRHHHTTRHPSTTAPFPDPYPKFPHFHRPMSQPRSGLGGGNRPAALLALLLALMMGCCHGFHVPSPLAPAAKTSPTALGASWLRNPLAPSPSSSAAGGMVRLYVMEFNRIGSIASSPHQSISRIIRPIHTQTTQAKKEEELLTAIRGLGRREEQNPQEAQARVRTLIKELEAAKGIPRPARAPQVGPG